MSEGDATTRDLRPAPEGEPEPDRGLSPDDLKGLVEALPQIRDDLAKVVENLKADIQLVSDGRYISLIRTAAAHLADVRRLVGEAKEIAGKAAEAVDLIRQALRP